MKIAIKAASISILLFSLASCTISFVPSKTSANETAIPSSDTTSEASVSSSSSPIRQEDDDFAPEGYRLSWSDEFDGTSLSMANWEYQIGNGNGGWGNGEAQYYTDHNDDVSSGFLTIEAKREETIDGDVDNQRLYRYTSTRIRTYHKVYTTYGYVAARIRLSAITGLWPAFWMLPESNYGSEGVTWWPTSGEIDIMENKGRVADKTSGALHYSSNGTGGSHTYNSREVEVGDIEDFHVYAVRWEANLIEWSVDMVPFFSINSLTWNKGYQTGDDAPFNRPFHIILNLAIGGQFDNYAEPPSDWQSSSMEVDYVRIYQAI